MRVRIVTPNVWNTEGDPQRQGSINRELRLLDPDFVALQEVVQTTQTRQLDALLDGLTLHRTHQADAGSFVPPFSERYTTPPGRSSRSTPCGGRRRSLGNARDPRAIAPRGRDTVHRRHGSVASECRGGA